ncbi:TetR/AcrR family transcriptional regulator C-terminal domain-containing protein [Neobacillus vireti]|uniref:TetR/AcrR family transcriptional regulator C-terminal domain-containing protein n=1 Tax=Neobacillus vireti TaxID=220686 RepID=UPI0030005E6B
MSKEMLKSQIDLMNALLKIMAQTEYPSITVSQICHVAGYNRGTFYQNYSSKDELLHDTIDTKLQDMFKILKKPTYSISKQGLNNTYEHLSLYNLLIYVKENYTFFKTVIEDKHIIGFRAKIFLNYQNYLQEMLLNPIENPNKDSDLDKIYYVYSAAASMGIITFWINQGLKQSPEYLISQFLAIVYQRPHDLIIGNFPFKHIKTKGRKEKDPRILRTQKSLSNSLIQLMDDYKYSEIKVNGILEHAHYNRSTFYSHYKSKDDLFLETVMDFVEEMIKSIRKVNDDQSIGYNSPLINFFTYIYENSKLLEVIGKNNQVPGFYHKIYQGLVDFLCEELNGRFDYDIEIYSNYLASTLLGVISLWVYEDLKYSPRFMAKVFKLYLSKLPKESDVNLSMIKAYTKV